MTTLAQDRLGSGPEDALPWRPMEYMDEYLENLSADEHPRTYTRTVRAGLARFSLFCEAEGLQHVDDITRRHILRYKEHLLALTKSNGRPLSLAYRQQLLKYVRGWINWMLELKIIEASPWQRINVGVAKKKPNPLEPDELYALFDAHRRSAFQISPFYYHRREVILVLIYGWGLRIHELESISVSSVDERLDWVTVINKGGKTKVLPYDLEMKKVVQRWLKQRGKGQIGHDALLTNEQGEPLGRRGIYQVIVSLSNAAGVSVNPHRLRDTFATDMLDGDVPVERLMVLLGHTRREQTLAYARVNDPKVAESHEQVMGPLLRRLVGEREL